ncbi:MAG: hypothetical protein GYB68_20240 [Chloroflexi bacterium]|nr:hypothetical protein [Chloroflexota bacterium]
MEYSISLALYDFLPGLFTGIALFFIAQMVRRADTRFTTLAFAGGGLVLLAGLLKATWKLIIAVGGPEILLLSELMFPLMAPGFTLVAFAVWGAIRTLNNKAAPNNLWLIASVLIVVAALAAFANTVVLGTVRGYFPIFLGLASISNVSLSVMLIAESIRRKRFDLAGLFFVNIAMVFALQPLAAMPEMSIAMHWFEQTLTSAGAATFAVAGYLMMIDVGVDVTIDVVDHSRMAPA